MDISPENWCLDPALVEEEIEKSCKTTAEGLIHKDTGRRVVSLMPVYTLGNIRDMDRFRSIADWYDILLIVDAACAIGATYRNMPFGGLADLSVLSFNGNKTITCGGGGAVVGNDEELLEHVRHLTTTARVWPDYDFDEVGFNYRMTNIQATVGCAQMERLDEFVESKRNTRDYYGTNLKDLASHGISFFSATPGSSCWFSGIVMGDLANHEDIKAICAKLKDEGIEARSFWKPVHLQKPYQDSPRGNMANSESLWQRIITLPCSIGITSKELEKVGEGIMSVLEL